MSKKTKKVKQLDKDCLSFVQAILEEDAKSAASVLKTIVKKHIAKKLNLHFINMTMKLKSEF